MKKIGLFGASGSIGTQTLDILRREKSMELSFFSVHTNLTLAKKIIEDFSPKTLLITSEEAFQSFGSSYEGTKVYGVEDIEHIIKSEEADIVLNAMMGMSGLAVSWWVLEGGGKLALANKESLVSAGSLITELVKKKGGELLPVDSEHSALWQCMEGKNQAGIDELILTASGGAFRDLSKEDMLRQKAADALKHPNWSMGEKITIDSATMMNKGLEVMEAKWLFDVKPSQIKVLLHKESIVHSLVRYVDGSLLAQLGVPDMRQPIHYALHEKNREPLSLEPLALEEIGALHFEKVDEDKYPSLGLCYRALEEGGNRPLLLNTINEILVHGYLEDRYTLSQVFSGLEKTFELDFFEPRDLQDLLEQENTLRRSWR